MVGLARLLNRRTHTRRARRRRRFSPTAAPQTQGIVTSVLIFPLAFSINAAYTRRQYALVNFASIKADLWALYSYHDYWLQELAMAAPPAAPLSVHTAPAANSGSEWDRASTRTSPKPCGVPAGTAFGPPGDHDEVFNTMQSLLIGIRGCVRPMDVLSDRGPSLRSAPRWSDAMSIACTLRKCVPPKPALRGGGAPVQHVAH